MANFKLVGKNFQEVAVNTEANPTRDELLEALLHRTQAKPTLLQLSEARLSCTEDNPTMNRLTKAVTFLLNLHLPKASPSGRGKLSKVVPYHIEVMLRSITVMLYHIKVVLLKASLSGHDDRSKGMLHEVAMNTEANPTKDELPKAWLSHLDLHISLHTEAEPALVELHGAVHLSHQLVLHSTPQLNKIPRP